MTAMNGESVIWSGATTAPLVYNGKTYTANVRPSPLNFGIAGIAWYENGVQIGGTWNIPAPDCPPCTPAYYQGTSPVGFYTIRPDLYGGADCYTNRNTADTRGPIGSTVCYIDIAFINAGAPTTCTDNGVTYNTGQQIKKYSCYSNFVGKTCSDNYYFAECHSGTWGTASQCYPGPSCQSVVPNPIPNPTPTCTNGETGNCQTAGGCAGTVTCSNNQWGACIKNDNACDSTPANNQWMFYVLLGVAAIIIIYGGWKMPRNKSYSW